MAGVGPFRRALRQHYLVGHGKVSRSLIVAGCFVVAASTALALPEHHANGATTALVGAWEPETIADTNYVIPSGALFVSNTGSDTNPGTQAAPLATVLAAIQKSRSGATIVLRGGTYRETLGTINIPITIQAYPHEQAWLKGSKLATGFVASSTLWTTPWTSTICNNCYPAGVLDPLYPTAGMADQVFVDGAPLAEVASRAATVPGSFFMDRANHQVVLGTNPAGHTIEVTAYERAIQFNSGAAGSAVKGIGIEHYGAHYNSDIPAMLVSTAPKLLLDKDTFAFSSSRGVSFYGANNVLTDNTFINNGMNGVHSHQTTQVVFKRNRVAFSNFERFSIVPSATGSVAAIKMTLASGGIYDSNIVDDNGSNGLWFDVSSSNNTVVNNTSVRNAGHGISVEMSGNTIVAGNMIVGNGRDGLKISGSNIVEIWNNTIFGNGWAQLGVYEDPRQNPPASILALGVTWDTSKVRVMNNVIVGGPYSTRPVLNSFDLTSPHHATTQTMITSQDNNIWGRTTVLGMKYLATVQGTLTATARYIDLPAMQAATRRELRSKSVDNLPIGSVFVNLNTGDMRLAAVCPKPAVAALPAAVASAMGVATTVATVGSLKAPIA